MALLTLQKRTQSHAPEQSNSDGDAECFGIAGTHQKRLILARAHMFLKPVLWTQGHQAPSHVMGPKKHTEKGTLVYGKATKPMN
jgi:hypothetical protein